MASYSMEDVEFIRSKSGISYEEAVSMLDYHSGDVARVLIDLEKSGRLKAESTWTQPAKTAPVNEEKEGSKIVGFLQKLYRTRIKVQKGNTVIVNLSVLFMALAVLLFSPHLAIVSLIIGLLLGYKISIDRNDEAFQEEKVETIVRNAADNVKQAVNSISREIGKAVEKKEKKAESAAAEEKVETISVQANPVQATRPQTVSPTTMPDLNAGIVRELEKEENGRGVPVIQVPVRTESTDSGSVEVVEDENGYHTATIG